MGGTRAEHEDEIDLKKLPDDAPISIWEHPSGELAEPGERGARPVERTAAERAEKHGRGFLGSTEF